MEKINFSNGEKISSAKVTINNVDYEVTPAVYDGATPLNATVFNNMQNNIETAINTKADSEDVYEKTETYTKQEVNALIPAKGHQINVATSVDTDYKVNVLYSDNLINPQFATTTQNGVTCTNNGDGTYTLNGTATDVCQFNLMTNLNFTGTYKLIGCPSSGSQNTYYMFARNAAWSKFVGDVGEGKVGTFDNTMNTLAIAIQNGVTCDNVVFKPMITKDTSKTYSDFKPYIVPSIQVDNEEIYRKPKVLWENPSITSDFAAQTITLNDSLANYSYYEVIFLMSKYEQLAVSTGLIPASMGTSLLTLRNASGTGTISRYRDLTKTDNTTLAITACYQATGGNTAQATNIDRIIPYQIIGHA